MKHRECGSNTCARTGFWYLCAVLFLCVLFSASAFAQNDVGTIVGYVTDPSGAVVSGATVTVTNQGTRETRTITTDAQGHYAFPNLSPATYTLKFTAPNFKEYDSSNNALPVSTTIDIDAKLQLGQQTETIQVSDTAAVLQTQSAAVQSEITGTQIQTQELNGRNPVYMTQFLPGVTSTATLGDFNYSFNGGDSFNINGARSQDTEYYIDGAPAVRTRDDGEIVAGVNVDSVQEMQVLTADYSAEYGGASGAQVRIVSKSGTTSFHGTLYEYIRNAALNANTWSRNLVPSTRFVTSPFVYNNFGFAVGGPIYIPKVPVLAGLKNKFFFFINEDWIRYRQSSTSTGSFPSTLMRQGNFSELLPAGNPWYSKGQQLYEPNTCTAAGPGVTPAAGCVPFAGNIIPATYASPNGVAMLNAYPATNFLNGTLPGNGTTNWQATAPNPINQRKGQINGDLFVRPNQHLSFRRSDNSYVSVSPFSTTGGLMQNIQPRPNFATSLGWTWTINPTMINEAHVSGSVDDVHTNVNPISPGINRGKLGITPLSPNGINFPYIIPGFKSLPNRIPTLNNLSQFSAISGGPYPSSSAGPIITASDSLTKVLGNHTVKAGVYWEYMGENDFDQINVSTVPGGASNQNGTFTMSDARSGLGATTGAAIANVYTGYADSYTEIGTRAYTVWRGTMWEEFVQDNWQVNPKLNFDYGLRITTIIPPGAKWANADYFDPASYNPANAPQQSPTTGLLTLGTGNVYNGIVIPGWSSFPSSATFKGRVPAANPANNLCAGQPCTGLFAPHLHKGYAQTKTLWLPRIGVAYQIRPKTVLRAGIGRFAEEKGIIDNIFPGGNSPFQPTEGVSFGATAQIDNPGAAITSTVTPPLQITTMSKNLVPPSRVNYNLTIQQQLPWNSSAQIAYVGAVGRHNWIAADINQMAAGNFLLPANAGKNINYLRPYKGFAFITQEQAIANEAYNGLQASFRKQTRDGSSIGVAYTWSREMDNGSNYHTIIPDTYNRTNLWGLSEYDIRNILIINGLYAVPLFRGQTNLAGKLLGGWQLSAAVQWQPTGESGNIGNGSTDYAGIGLADASFNSTGNNGEFWVQNGKPSYPKKFAGPGGTPNGQYFNIKNGSTPIWTAPTLGTFNLQKGVRDAVHTVGLNDWNVALIKTFAIYKANALEFRAEAYDFPNHANWSGPSFNANSSTFGQVISKTGLSRNLQFGLRYRF